MTKDVAGVLNAAADLLEKPGAWIQGYLGKTRGGEPTEHAEEAVCFCAYGAIAMARGQNDLSCRIAEPERVFEKLVGQIDKWNDAPGRTQAEVVAKLREAAALAERAKVTP